MALCGLVVSACVSKARDRGSDPTGVLLLLSFFCFFCFFFFSSSFFLRGDAAERYDLGVIDHEDSEFEVFSYRNPWITVGLRYPLNLRRNVAVLRGNVAERYDWG